MSKYPRLAEMGVLHPGQIDSYTINSIGYIDYLRILYVRPKGSLLPVSRSYKFPRMQKSAVVNKDSGQTNVVMESDPKLREAVDELKDILDSRESVHSVKEAILQEIAALEEEIAVRNACLRELVQKIPGD